MAKLRRTSHNGKPYSYVFHCPGCDRVHQFFVSGPKTWNFNGDMEKPTFAPSLLNYWPNDDSYRCHLFLKNGVIEYCNDCTHELAGQKVPLPELHGTYGDDDDD